MIIAVILQTFFTILYHKHKYIVFFLPLGHGSDYFVMKQQFTCDDNLLGSVQCYRLTRCSKSFVEMAINLTRESSKMFSSLFQHKDHKQDIKVAFLLVVSL